MFQPSALRLGVSAEANALKCMGVGDSYRVRLRRRIPFPEWVFKLTTGSMMEHCCCMHGVEPAIDWNRLPVSQTEHHPQVYDKSFLWTTKRCPCHFPGCMDSYCTWNILRSHFIIQHWGCSISILEDQPNPYPSTSTVGAISHQGGLTPGTMHMRISNREWISNSNTRTYSASLRQVGSCSR